LLQALPACYADVSVIIRGYIAYLHPNHPRSVRNVGLTAYSHDIYNFVSYSVTQQPKSDKGCLILRFLDHTQLDTHPSDQLVAEAATFST